MHTIFATNVNDAYRRGLALLARHGEGMPSRNGPVLRLHMPVTTRYARPMQRVLFDRQRNANPFFHLIEGLWMLAGRNDVDTLMQFVASFHQFSDDGMILHGAYGHRWRHWPPADGMDQLDIAIEMLQRNLNDRRVVVAMWDPVRDLSSPSKDVPCNDMIKFMMVHGSLDMMVFCRSNDIIFGCYGANAVHMSMLHEYMASMVGVPIGSYYQISTDFHAYMETPYQWPQYYPLDLVDSLYRDPYGSPEDSHVLSDPVSPYPMIADSRTFDEELELVVDAIQARRFHTMPLDALTNRFFADVVQPMYAAHQYIKQNSKSSAHMALRLLHSKQKMADGTRNDWITAGTQWVDHVIIKRYGGQ